MCEAKVYFGGRRKGDLVMEEVAVVEIEGDRATLIDVSGNKKQLSGFSKVMIDNLNHIIVFSQ